MAINFANEHFCHISCDKICSDHHAVENLISSRPEARRKGFQTEYYIRPPVIVSIDFTTEFTFDLMAMELGLKIRDHKSTGIEVYATNGHQSDVLLAVFRHHQTGSCDTLTLVNENYRPGRFLKPLDRTFTGAEKVRAKNWRYCTNLKNIKIKIFSTANSSVPCLSFLNLYGKPTNLTPEKAAQIISVIENQQNGDAKKPEPETQNRLDQATLESLAPREFFDSITEEMMRLPYILPSGKNVDKATLERFDGGDPKDPFTQVTFTDSYKPLFNAELKARIDLFFETNGQSEIDRRNETRKRLLNWIEN